MLNMNLRRVSEMQEQQREPSFSTEIDPNSFEILNETARWLKRWMTRR